MAPKRIPPSWSREPLPAPRRAADGAEAAAALKAAARELGFDPVGITDATLPAAEVERLEEWLRAGYQASMRYLEPPGRHDPCEALPGAASVLCVGLAYPPSLDPERPPHGSTYAQGRYDYHRVLGARLEHLSAFAQALLPGVETRRFCDTAPLLERPLAAQAGLGFIGKNTLLIHPERGSFFFLGGLILDRALPADLQPELPGCGSCTRCLDVCPTDAFPRPYVLDARRCISYLTIELRGSVPEELREPMGEHVFGCDLCQSVCPWNGKFAPPGDPELGPDPERASLSLLELGTRAQASFKKLAKDTPWWRTTKRGFLRNVATAAGNSTRPEELPLLEALAQHENPTVREHAEWALERRRAADTEPL